MPCDSLDVNGWSYRQQGGCALASMIRDSFQGIGGRRLKASYPGAARAWHGYAAKQGHEFGGSVSPPH